MRNVDPSLEHPDLIAGRDAHNAARSKLIELAMAMPVMERDKALKHIHKYYKLIYNIVPKK